MNELEDLVAAYRILAEHGVIDAYGHVSLRSPRDPTRYYLARSIATRKGSRRRSSGIRPRQPAARCAGRESVRERFIHGEIYKPPEVMAVVHNHSPRWCPSAITTCRCGRSSTWRHSSAGPAQLRDPRCAERHRSAGEDGRISARHCKELEINRQRYARHGAVVGREGLPRAGGPSVYLEISARMQMQALLLARGQGEITYVDGQRSRPRSSAGLTRAPGRCGARKRSQGKTR